MVNSFKVKFMLSCTMALMAFNLGNFAVSQPRQKSSEFLSAKSPGTIRYSQIPSPESGVKLLEDIFQHVRTVPQLAMVQPTIRTQGEKNIWIRENSPTDYRLTIKPRETSSALSSTVASGSNSNSDMTNIQSRGSARQLESNLGIWERKSKQVTQAPIVMAQPLTDAAAKPSGIWENQIDKTISSALPQAPTNSDASLLGVIQGWGKIDHKAGITEYQIGLLPPNVIMGIPLVRLGCLDKQANRTLRALGSVHKQTINEWTIYSYSNPQTGEPLVQVFVHHGIVEGLRVFESELAGSDLGVKIGDDLNLVKEKYGEPAFILAELAPGTGQNYIYPISRVGFLLSRSKPGSLPKVASILLFMVK